MAKNKLIAVIICIIISFFIVRHCMNVGVSIVETISSSLLYPLLRIQHAIIVPIARWYEHRTTMHDLRNNLEQLQKANEELCAENSALKASHSYIHETTELRNFNKRYDVGNKGRMVQVLARHFSPTEQFFLVDAGSSQGIKKDMVALYCNNIVGKVTQVYPWYCKVCLITDADCKVAATCISARASKDLAEGKIVMERNMKKGVNGIHEGCNDIMHTAMYYVSHLESVKEDDTVISSGEGLIFPKGFALGKVISAKKGELFYIIAVQPFLDFQTLSYCTLIAKENM